MLGRKLLTNNVASVCTGFRGKLKPNLLIAKGQSLTELYRGVRIIEARNIKVKFEIFKNEN